MTKKYFFCKIILNKKKITILTGTHTCKEIQKPSVSKTYSVGFNHNAELPNKKLIQMIKPF